MKLLIFGATGGTGRLLVGQALERGHMVSAFVRTLDKLKIDHPNLKFVRGDVLDLPTVETAVKGQEAVLSTIGAGDKRTQIRTEGTRKIIKAMEKEGVRRFISLSTIGIGDSRKLLPFHYKYFLVPLLLRHAFADHKGQENQIEQSNLDWTIVRAAALTDGPLTKAYRHGFTSADKPIEAKISRADVADFMLKQLTDDLYLHQAPCISN